MSNPTHPIPPGTQIAGYRIESLIGRGGMAFVYCARDPRLDRRVALKILSPALFESAESRQRFLRESRLAASMDHPNILPIYDAGEADNLLYIAMRYVEGGDLKQLVERKGRLDVTSTTRILSQVAAALDTAHASGLVHRDVKPANILIASGVGPETREHAYLSDFGITKQTSATTTLTVFGQFVGTIEYVAPEQIAHRAVDGRSDVYSLGCVAYHCLTGTVPFARDNEAALLWAHLVDTPPPVSGQRVDLHPVDAVLVKAMAKNPNERYETCAEFVADLARFSEQPAPAPPGRSREQSQIVLQDERTGSEPLPAPPEPEPLTEAQGFPGVPGQDGHGGSRGGGSAKSSDRRDVVSFGDKPPPVDAPPTGGRSSGDGTERPSWFRRVPRVPVLIAAAVVVLALLGSLLARELTSGPSRATPATAPADPVIAQECRAAFASADQSLGHAGHIEAAMKEHIQIMTRLDYGEITPEQASNQGRPSLTKGASASAQFDTAFNNYQQIAEKCRSSTGSGGDCKNAVGSADQTLGHAREIEAALKEHTDVMAKLYYGEIAPHQAHAMGQPSLTKGASASAQFDQALTNYQQAVGNCH